METSNLVLDYFSFSGCSSCGSSRDVVSLVVSWWEVCCNGQNYSVVKLVLLCFMAWFRSGHCGLVLRASSVCWWDLDFMAVMTCACLVLVTWLKLLGPPVLI